MRWKVKKGTFLEKKGGYFKLSGENILTSILTAFHPFLTLPNKTLKREKGTFFFSLKRSLQKREKGTFFAVGSDVLISAKKEP